MTTRNLQSIAFAALSLTIALVVAHASRAEADLAKVGLEFQINTYTTDDQYGIAGHSVARASDGSFVVVWSGVFQDGDFQSIQAQRFDAAGAADGTEFRVNTYTTSAQLDPGISSMPDGRSVVVWSSTGQDGSGRGVYGQRFEAAGASDGTEFQINSYTTDSQYQAAVSHAPDGSFVVVWRSTGQDGDGRSVHGQRFDAAGAPADTEFQINSYTTLNQTVPTVASGSDGRFIVVWASQGQDGHSSGVYGQRFDAAGAVDGTEFQINSYTTYGQDRPIISTAPDDSFVVVWSSSGQDGSGYSIHGQRFDSVGATDGSEFRINSYTTAYQSRPAVASDADGSFVVVWDSYAAQDGETLSVHGQQFDAAGAPDGTEFQINTYTTSYQGVSNSIAGDGAGNFVVVWASYDQDGNDFGTFGQLLCTNGNANCGVGCASTPATGCNVAAQAKLDVNESKAGKEKTRLQWKKLADATVQGDFGDPVTGTTNVSVCIYDDADALVQGYIVDRAAQQCAGVDCWKALGSNGYGYKDKGNSSDGIAKLIFKAGDSTKGSAAAQGKNNSAKGQTSLPIGVVAGLSGSTSPTIQMLTSDGFCSTATMNTVKKDAATRYSAQLK